MSPDKQDIVVQCQVLFQTVYIDQRHLFLQNKYSRWYVSIISQALTRIHVKGSYAERHHILPTCLGGSDEKSNIVKLSAKEHFVCHRLLTKMTTGMNRCRMANAVYRLTHRSKLHKETVKISSGLYERLKIDRSLAMSMLLRGRAPYKMTDETRHRMSIARQGIVRSQSLEERKNRSKNQMGRFVSEESKLKMSISAKNRIHHPHSMETRAKISRSNTGKQHSEEIRNQISAAVKNAMNDPIILEKISKSSKESSLDRCWINKAGKSKFVKRHEVETFLADGWLSGRASMIRRTKAQLEKVGPDR